MQRLWRRRGRRVGFPFLYTLARDQVRKDFLPLDFFLFVLPRARPLERVNAVFLVVLLLLELAALGANLSRPAFVLEEDVQSMLRLGQRLLPICSDVGRHVGPRERLLQHGDVVSKLLLVHKFHRVFRNFIHDDSSLGGLLHALER